MLDRLAAAEAPAEKRKRCQVLYVSPLKALAYDVERNLRAALTGLAIEPEPACHRCRTSVETDPNGDRAHRVWW